MLAAPHPRYRVYSELYSHTSFVQDVISKRLHVGDQVAELERAICQKLDVKHAISMPQNRVGVYLAIKHLIKPGQNVVLSPYTIADIINMVICAGGRPVFADVERETCNIDPAEAERLIDENTGAVLVTHLHGLGVPMERLSEICKARGIPLIEDAAQAFGAKQGERRLGTIGHAGVFSFGMYKNVNAWFGGAVVTNDDALAARIRNEIEAFPYQTAAFIAKKWKKGLLTDFVTLPPIFKSLTFWIFRYGYLNDIEWINKRVRTELDTSPKERIPEEYLRRMTPFQARLILKQLDNVDRNSQERIDRAMVYHAGLRDIPELVIPPARTDFSHIYTYFPIQCADRTALIKHMMKNHRDVAAQHYKNTADLPGFSEFHRDCPNSRAVAEQLIFLPTYPRYPISDVKKSVAVIRSFFGRK